MNKVNTNQLKQTLTTALRTKGHITFLTGAGVSAESGIPTYRGGDGYWTVGSINYKPQEIATRKMFLHNPREVWRWTLYIRAVCQAAEPNPGHWAIAHMEQILNQRSADDRHRFQLITQNIDGLHLRAGNTPEQTYQVHGNVNMMRCTRGCSTSIYPIPDELLLLTRDEQLTEAQWHQLVCPKCGARTRPNELFWDEFYNEEFYRSESALQVSRKTALLIIVGTTGATLIPNQIVSEVLSHGGTIIDVNIEETKFSDIARGSFGGMFLKGSSGEILPIMLELIQV